MQHAGARRLREDVEGRPAAAQPRLQLVEPAAERRTVIITGQAAPPPRRRRSAAQQQIEARPDRVALWAFLLGIFLVLVAAATANAAPL